MAVGPQGTAVFVGTRKTDVYTVMDRDHDRVADDVQQFAPPIDFKVPNGVCFSKDGHFVLGGGESDPVLSAGRCPDLQRVW